MPGDFLPSDSPQNLWQSQKTEGIQMSMEELRRRADRLRGRVFWRNVREYVGAVIVVAFFGFNFVRNTDPLARTGYALIVAGTLLVVWQLYRKGSSRSLPTDMGLASGVEFYQRELERQRDLVASVGTWYLGPLLPGWVVLMVSVARSNPGHVRQFTLFFTVLNIVAGGFFFFIWKLNRRAARKLQEQVDALKSLGGTL